jgi:hypothetical protein
MTSPVTSEMRQLVTKLVESIRPNVRFGFRLAALCATNWEVKLIVHRNV